MSWLWLGDQETTMWCEIQAPDAVWSPVTSPLDEWSSFHLGAATHPALINSLPDSTYFDILRQGLTMDVAMAVLELTLQTSWLQSDHCEGWNLQASGQSPCTSGNIGTSSQLCGLQTTLHIRLNGGSLEDCTGQVLGRSGWRLRQGCLVGPRPSEEG